VWLDATGLESFGARFPTIAAALHEIGLDPSRDLLPVAPAAHYLCGGIVTDLRGSSSLPGLWVAGEAACNGVHGANRLASNSLLDGMVFGPRVVEAIDAGARGPAPTGAMRCVLPAEPEIAGRTLAVDLCFDEGEPLDRAELQEAMTASAGVLRSAESLAVAHRIARRRTGGDGREHHEVRNLQTVAQALVAAATAREETRGAHSRSDHPTLAEHLRVRFIVGG
jgi:L-aspartate oxidase